jgi:hypothetical protein
MPKRKQLNKVTYVKGLTYNRAGVLNCIDWINQKGVEVYVLNSGDMTDGTGFVTIRIEGFK